MPEQLSLTQLDQYTFATNERMKKKESGLPLDEEPDKFTAFYHRDNGGVEKSVLVQDVNEITKESQWNPLLDEGFVKVAHLLEDKNSIPVGEREDGRTFELSYGSDGPIVTDRVQIQQRRE